LAVLTCALVSRIAPAQPSSATPEPAEASAIEAALAADQKAREPEPEREDRGASATESMNPDLSLIANVAGAWFDDGDHLQSGAHDPDHTGFNLLGLELTFGASVDPYFRFDGTLVFSEFGVELEEAFATTLDMPLQLQARVGQFLTRFGRINPTHPHAWDFVDQPFAIGRVFGGEANRGLGVELSWLAPLPWYVELVASTIEARGAASNRSFFGGDDLGVESPADLLFVNAVKQFFPLTDDWSLAWGVSGAFGPNSTGRANRSDVYGTDVYLKYRPISRASPTIVSLQTEVIYRRRQVPESLLWDVSAYSQLFWRFAERFGSGLRYEYGSPAFDRGGRREGDPLDPEWTDSRHRLTAAFTHWPTEFSRVRLQASRDMPGWREPIHAVFIAAQFVTGAHGAHVF
jgi:hypothetical protein